MIPWLFLWNHQVVVFSVNTMKFLLSFVTLGHSKPAQKHSLTSPWQHCPCERFDVILKVTVSDWISQFNPSIHVSFSFSWQVLQCWLWACGCALTPGLQDCLKARTRPLSSSLVRPDRTHTQGGKHHDLLNHTWPPWCFLSIDAGHVLPF